MQCDIQDAFSRGRPNWTHSTQGSQIQRTTLHSCLKWLKWVSLKKGIRIQHARNGEEFKIGNIAVDGYHAESNTCYEFFWDLWHGCRRCYTRRNMLLPGIEKTFHDVYAATMERLSRLRKMGYKVETMWECDFLEERKENPDLDDFVKNMQVEEPLNPRHGFYGGRTNATKLYHKIQGNEKIKYVDVCSLYPWVCKYARYPLGHPEIITESFGSIFSSFGLVKCKIYPTRKLFHPVLPSRSSDSKLLFPLHVPHVR